MKRWSGSYLGSGVINGGRDPKFGRARGRRAQGGSARGRGGSGFVLRVDVLAVRAEEVLRLEAHRVVVPQQPDGEGLRNIDLGIGGEVLKSS